MEFTKMQIQIELGKEKDIKGLPQNNKIIIDNMTSGEMDMMRCLLKSVFQFTKFENVDSLIGDLSLESVIKQMSKSA